MEPWSPTERFGFCTQVNSEHASNVLDNLRSLRDHKADTIRPHTSTHSRNDSAPLAGLLISRPIHQRSISLDVIADGPRRHAGFVSGGADEQPTLVLVDVLPRITSATPAVPHTHTHMTPTAFR